MDKVEQEGCARLFSALSQLDDPQKGYDEVLSAICQIAGTTNGGLWGVPQNFLVAPHLADVSYIKPDDGCHEIHSYLPQYPAFEYMVSNWAKFNVFKPIDVIGWNAWTNSGFYQDYLRRYDRKDNIVGVMRDSKGAPRWFFSTCHTGRNAIKPGSAKLLAEWTPLIARGLENLERFRERLGRLESLELIAQNTDSALVVLKLGARGARPSLTCASAPAARILALESCAVEKNLELQQLLRLSTHARGPSNSYIEWTSRAGQKYSLVAVAGGPAAPPGTLLVRMLPIAPAHSIASDRDAALRSGLSNREADIFALLAKGLGNREIGHELHISPNTARTHIENVYEKLGVSNRIEAVNKVRNAKPRRVTAMLDIKKPDAGLAAEG